MDNTSGCGTVGSWYTRCKSPWKRASEQEIEAVTNYLTTHQEETIRWPIQGRTIQGRHHLHGLHAGG